MSASVRPTEPAASRAAVCFKDAGATARTLPSPSDRRGHGRSRPDAGPGRTLARKTAAPSETGTTNPRARSSRRGCPPAWPIKTHRLSSQHSRPSGCPSKRASPVMHRWSRSKGRARIRRTDTHALRGERGAAPRRHRALFVLQWGTAEPGGSRFRNRAREQKPGVDDFHRRIPKTQLRC